MHDAIIVGGGPAGALTLGRSRRRVLLLDAGQGRNAPAAAIHNLLAHDGTPPEELRRIGREQLTRYPSVELRQGTVDGAHALADEGFQLLLGGGERLEARGCCWPPGSPTSSRRSTASRPCGAARRSTARTARLRGQRPAPGRAGRGTRARAAGVAADPVHR